MMLTTNREETDIDKQSWTALEWATIEGSAEHVEGLLEKDAGNMQYDEQVIARTLHLAMICGYHTIAKTLLAARDTDGTSGFVNRWPTNSRNVPEEALFITKRCGLTNRLNIVRPNLMEATVDVPSGWWNPSIEDHASIVNIVHRADDDGMSRSERHVYVEYKNGDVYEGQWMDKRQIPHGSGTYIWRSGLKYVGNWVYGTKSGHGEQIFPCGVKYVGLWLNDKRHENGRQEYLNGALYHGGWQKGEELGYGVQTYASGDKYNGGWKEGMWHGYGEMTLPRMGRTYRGGFANGQEHGYAEICRELPDGRRYDGGIRQGKRHGYGFLSTPIATMEGGFKDDRQDGWQEIRAPMRHDYSGTYRDGHMWGVGHMYEYATGKIFDGVWEKNVYKGPLRHELSTTRKWWFT